jgi:hypothetical protein
MGGGGGGFFARDGGGGGGAFLPFVFIPFSVVELPVRDGMLPWDVAGEAALSIYRSGLLVLLL